MYMNHPAPGIRSNTLNMYLTVFSNKLASPRFGGLEIAAEMTHRCRSKVLASQDSSKGGAVETGCSDLYDVIY